MDHSVAAVLEAQGSFYLFCTCGEGFSCDDPDAPTALNTVSEAFKEHLMEAEGELT